MSKEEMLFLMHSIDARHIVSVILAAACGASGVFWLF